MSGRTASSSEPNPTPAILDTARLAEDLKKYAAGVEVDAYIAACMPATWLFIARFAKARCRLADVADSLLPDNQAAHFSLRTNHNKESVRAGYEALEVNPSATLLDGARYIAHTFSADAIIQLRSKAYRFHNVGVRVRGASPPWWELLPVQPPSAEEFLEVLREERDPTTKALHCANLASIASAHFGPTVRTATADFLANRECKQAPESSEDGEPSGPFFALRGLMRVDPRVEGRIRRDVTESIRRLVGVLPLDACRQSVETCTGIVSNKLYDALHHGLHCLFTDEQRGVAGDLVMEGWPLLYWAPLAADAKPGSVKAGRKSSFAADECACILAELTALHAEQDAHIARTQTAAGGVEVSNKIDGIRGSYRSRAGDYCYERMSGIRILDWADECGRISDTIGDDACPVDRAERDAFVARIQKRAERARNILHLLLAKNGGLMGKLHSQALLGAPSYRNMHASRDLAAIVREEMMKAICAYDPYKGNRFSTYAVCRVSAEMRRRPIQEAQLLKMGHDHTTAMPRLAGLAAEVSLSPGDPDYFETIARLYNEKYGKTPPGGGESSEAEGECPAPGRKRNPRGVMTAAAVQAILASTTVATLTPTAEDESNDRPAIQVANEEPDVPDEEMAEIGEGIARTAAKLAPGEELALAILSQAVPPGRALGRFTAHLAKEGRARIKAAVQYHAKPADVGSGKVIRLRPGVLGKVKINTKVSDESRRLASRAAEREG